MVSSPQQRKLMGSSAQNSSGVHWCRRRVKFNEVPEKVPEKVAGALMQSQVRFKRVPEKVALVQSQVRFNRVPEKVPEKALAHSQVRFNRICGHLIHGNPAEVFQRLASQHPSERFVKKNVVAVGDTTEAYFQHILRLLRCMLTHIIYIMYSIHGAYGIS